MMTLTILKQNILDVNEGIIGHQVNAMGVMGAGLAKHLAKKYPSNYRAYRNAYRKGDLNLGSLILHQLSPQLYIGNLVAQDKYGTDKRYTNYDYLAESLSHLHNISIKYNLTPYLPYGLGCGLGGGDWSVVNDIISTHCPNAILCQL
ncbi:hypothetical protein WEU38_12070 [Cyanobacterium aponinum AL20118]